jgi:hypothetical protein
VTGRRGRRSKQLLDDDKENRGHCKLKEKALRYIYGGLNLEEAMDLS